MTGEAAEAELAAAVDRLRRSGITRVESYAWRDLDDPEAGGSEVHADEILGRWAAAGLEVVHRTSTADAARTFRRNGYEVVQRGGRYDVFARVFLRQLVRRRPADTATIEIWNGVPWFGPIWARRRRVVWMHHVHRDMWLDALPRPLGSIGRWVETTFSPWWYRSDPVATLSDSSATEIEEIGIPARNLHVIPPGVDDRFTPDPDRRAPTPRVVVVGRLAPVKRHRVALDALAAARDRHPSLTVELIGDGPSRRGIERWVADHDASSWVETSGRVSDDELVDAYRRAWLVVSASHAEGWGMSLTEGAACGTPCAATDIAGHRGAAVDGTTGVLVGEGDLARAIADLLADDERRVAMGDDAVRHAAGFSWTAVAARHAHLLADVVG